MWYWFRVVAHVWRGLNGISMSPVLVMTLLIQVAILPFLHFPPFFLFQKLLSKAASGLNNDWLTKEDLLIKRASPVINCLEAWSTGLSCLKRAQIGYQLWSDHKCNHISSGRELRLVRVGLRTIYGAAIYSPVLLPLTTPPSRHWCPATCHFKWMSTVAQ